MLTSLFSFDDQKRVIDRHEKLLRNSTFIASLHLKFLCISIACVTVGKTGLMESGEGGIRWRKQNLNIKPVRRKREEDGSTEVAEMTGTAAEEESEPLSPASRLFHEPDFNVHIIAIMGCKTRINPDVVKAKLVDTLLKHPRFSSLQVMDEKNGGEMKWVRTAVDLDSHVIVPNLDITMDSTDNFVEDYISNLSKTTTDKSKPLWDLHLLHVKTSEAEAVGVFRIHHSLGDGTSLMSLLLACTHKVSDPEALPTVPVKKKQALSNSCAVWSVFRLVWNSVVDVLMFMATGLFLKDTETPLKGPPGVECTPRRFVHRTVSLDDMKLVKNAMNAAGLSRYLNRRYGEGKKDVGEIAKKNYLPKNIRLRSILLINLRPSAGIQALADMMEKNTKAKWGNWLGFVLLPVTIALRDDPLDYVREAKATVDRKKHFLEAICTFSIAELFLKFFGIKSASALSHRVISHTTMCFSNLVGPVEEIDFYGHPMAYLAPGSYGQPHALMINFQSHVDKMAIVLSVDEGTISNPHQLCDDLEESLKLIKDAVIARG